MSMRPRSHRSETSTIAVVQIITGWFRRGQKYSNWRSRGTNDWLLIYTVNGKGRFGFVGGEVIAEPGDLVLLRPGTLHDYGVESTLRRWELIWAHFHPRPHWVVWLNWPESAPGLMRLRIEDSRQRERIKRRFANAHELMATARRRREDLAMNALEQVLLWADEINPKAQVGRVDARMQLAMDEMCRNFHREITLDTLAQTCGLSVSRLAHLFREQTGTTPQRFLELQRIHRAKQLLELTALSVKEIAREVGFENPLYFSLRFKRHAGTSPRAYRAKLARIGAAGALVRMR
jgi:AraC family transcriptional regulator, arabinose operon regulatory protein